MNYCATYFSIFNFSSLSVLDVNTFSDKLIKNIFFYILYSNSNVLIIFFGIHRLGKILCI